MVSFEGLRRRPKAVLRLFAVWIFDLMVAVPVIRFQIAARMQRDLDLVRILGFDANLYLRQVSPKRRLIASRDPLLHYCLIGWREKRSPTLRFDPIFFSSRHLRLKGNPFLSLDTKGEKVPQNEIEALSGRPAGNRIPKGTVLIFHHARGGGSTKCLGLFEETLIEQGLWPVRLRLIANSDRLVILQTPGGLEAHDLVEGFGAFLTALEGMDLVRIVVSHVVDFHPVQIFPMLQQLSRYFMCPIDILLHDYIAVCARINLVNDEEKTCFMVPDVSRCRLCIQATGSEISKVDPSQWRQNFASLISSAENIFVLSDDMVKRLKPHIAKQMTVWRPEHDIPVTPLSASMSKNDILKIVVVGALNIAKGSKVIAALGAAILAKNAPVSIELFGESPEHSLLCQAGVKVHGRYAEGDVKDWLIGLKPHAAILPAIWPETWSFVLTQLISQRVPVFAFDHGAQAERLRAIGQGGFVLPSSLINQPDALLEVLLQFRWTLIACDSGKTQDELLSRLATS